MANRSPQTLVVVLDTATVVLARTSEDETALRTFGAAEHIRDELHISLADSERTFLDAAVHGASARLGAVRAGLAIRTGATAGIDDVLVDILAALARPAVHGRRGGATLRVRHGELTRREVEILGHLAQGRSDAEIADALVISPKTASVHVTNVKAKLGVDTRLEAALAARELGFGD